MSLEFSLFHPYMVQIEVIILIYYATHQNIFYIMSQAHKVFGQDTHSPNKKHGTNMILWTTLIFHADNENTWHEKSPLVLTEITLGLDFSLIHWKKLIHMLSFFFLFFFCINGEQMISKASINVGWLFDFL